MTVETYCPEVHPSEGRWCALEAGHEGPHRSWGDQQYATWEQVVDKCQPRPVG